MVDVMVDGVGLSKSGRTDFVDPIQIPIFPYQIYIDINNTNNLFISLKRFKIVYMCN